MRVMGRVESKEPRKPLKEARVVGARPPDHRRARLERDVDRCESVIAHRCRGLFCRPDARKERYKFVDNGLSFPPPPLGVRWLYRRARREGAIRRRPTGFCGVALRLLGRATK